MYNTFRVILSYFVAFEDEHSVLTPFLYPTEFSSGQVAKESINRVCEAAGLKSINKKRKVERKIQSLLGERPDLHNAGKI